MFLRELRKAPSVALLFLMAVVVIAIFARYFGTHDFYDVSRDRFLSPGTSGHFLGTDHLGRDVYSGLLLGARVSLIVGIFAAALSASIGILVGATAGFFGGKLDDLLMRITEMCLVVPRFFLVLLVVAFFGANVWLLAIVFGLLIWPPTARLVRAEFMSLKERPFVHCCDSRRGQQGATHRSSHSSECSLRGHRELFATDQSGHYRGGGPQFSWSG